MKKLHNFLIVFLIIVVVEFKPTIISADSIPVGSDNMSYQTCNEFADVFKTISINQGSYYYKNCYRAYCSYNVWNKANMNSNSGYRCQNGNYDPYLKISSDGCKNYNGSCNTTNSTYCTTVTYVDCNKTSDNKPYEGATTTTKKKTTTRVSTTKTTTKTTSTKTPTTPPNITTTNITTQNYTTTFKINTTTTNATQYTTTNKINNNVSGNNGEIIKETTTIKVDKTNKPFETTTKKGKKQKNNNNKNNNNKNNNNILIILSIIIILLLTTIILLIIKNTRK